MITKLHLRNFKAFDRLSIDIRPITILVGPNNSGKSAIIAALRILAQTIDSNDPLVPLLLNGRFGDFGTYKDVVYGNHRGRPINIDITFSGTRRHRGRDSKRKSDLNREEFVARLILDFKYRTRRREIILRASQLRVGGRLRLDTRYSKDTERQLLERIGAAEVPSPIKGSVSRILRMQNFVPNVFPSFSISTRQRDSATTEFLSEKIDEELRSLSVISRQIAGELQAIEYAGPLRASPSRTYLFAGERRRRIGLTGENAVNLIVMDSRRPRARAEPISLQISSWLRKAGMGADLRIVALSDRHYEIRVQHPVTEEHQNLADIGYGISQILPVLAGGYALEPRSTYLIEQPEIHLHPRAQSELGSFLADLYDRGVNTLVETHSEYLILRLQQYIAQGVIPPDQVQVIYIYPRKGGKIAKALSLDDRGKFVDDWPEGFFPERLEEAKKLARSRHETGAR